MGLQEKIVTDDWYSETPSSVNLARKICTKREKADRINPTNPTHFNLDLNFIFPSPFILSLSLSTCLGELGANRSGVLVK